MEPQIFRYSLKSLMGDYIRSGVGLALTGLPASQLPSSSVGFWLLSVLGLLFVSLAVHTIQRQITRIVMTDETIGGTRARNTIKWSNIREVNLAYFSTRTDRKNGWMQLTIACAQRKLRLDSRIDGFHTIAAAVLDHTRHSNVLLSVTSSSNFEALGLNQSSHTQT